MKRVLLFIVVDQHTYDRVEGVLAVIFTLRILSGNEYR